MNDHISNAMALARAYRTHIASIVSAIVLVVLLAFPVLRDAIWSVAFVDILVIVTLIGAAVIVFLGRRSAPSAGEPAAKSFVAPEGLTALAAALAIFVTYASFRNQTRLAAEMGLNTEGQMLFEMEMDSPTLRCLYTNFAHDNPRACLEKFTSDPEQWSAQSFYVEGVIWLLEKAEDDRKAWGSAYSGDIDYWRQYVNEDPTGLFSYYLVSFHGSFEGAREGMRRAAIDITGLCRKYRIVHMALERANARPAPSVTCP